MKSLRSKSDSPKKKLQQKFGSLRNAAKQLGISRFRLSDLVNGWATPEQEELKKLKLEESDFKLITKK